MKLIYIANARLPTQKAYGYQISKMCEEFAHNGAKVELWFPSRQNDIRKSLFDYYNLERNFKIKEIKCFDFIRFSKYLKSFGFWLQRLFFLIKLFFQKVDKKTTIYSRDPEIVWLFDLKGHKTIFECHRFPQSYIWLFKIFGRQADKIIVLTSRLKGLFIENNFNKDKILVSPDGVDLKIFDIEISKAEARKKLCLPVDKIILGYTGRFKTMGKGKGLEEIFKAIKLVLLDFNNICFVAIGGSQEDIKYYQESAEEMGLPNNVLLLERTEQKDLSVFQKACDILLMPFPNTEHYAYYMSPLKMFEYMASQRPIITSDLPSVREVLNGQSCLFCQPDDCKNLAEKIKQLLNDKNLGEKLAGQAYLDVKNYSWQKRAEGILEFVSLVI